MHLVGLSLVVIMACIVVIQAECPNGCSGRGSCSSKDMCQCYKNFQGNDCSERTCGFGYAHTDTPKGDLNMDNNVNTDAVLVNSQVYPYGTYEQYNPSAVDEEGHFYMECSNQGLCDREVGDCVCFDGFEGSACQRASCPNSCSNHGSCESISEFATTAGGTLFTKGKPSGDTTYDLWDAKVSYGCRCDPWFTGADCSQRRCKVGVDPMYYDTEQVTYDTISINGVIASAKYIRIRFWDYWGESFITDRITAVADIEAAFEAAFEALPNGVISDVDCKEFDAGADHDFFSVQSSGAMLCQFKSNPGALRLPEIYENNDASSTITITGTPLRGEDENLCDTLLAANQITGIAKAVDLGLAGKITLSALLGDTHRLKSAGTTPYLVKINDQYVVVNGFGTDTTTTPNTHHLETSYPIVTADQTVTTDLYYSTTVLGAAINFGAATVGTRTITGAASAATSLVAGDKIICESQIFNVVSKVVVSLADVITLDRPFFGTAIGRAATTDTGDAAVDDPLLCYKITTSPPRSTTTYVSECAGRGLCDRESGVCSCFKGYTNDNCDKQSILAF